MPGCDPMPSCSRFRRLARLALLGLVCCISASAVAQEEPAQDPQPPEGLVPLNAAAEPPPLANVARATARGASRSPASPSVRRHSR